MSQAVYTDLTDCNLDNPNYVIAPYPTIVYVYTSSDD